MARDTDEALTERLTERLLTFLDGCKHEGNLRDTFVGFEGTVYRRELSYAIEAALFQYGDWIEERLERTLGVSG